MKLTLYRGISINPENAKKLVDEITEKGLSVNDEERASFNDKIYDISNILDELLNKKEISRKEDIIINPQIPVLCFGDEICAKFYALRNLKEKTPIIIKIEIDLSQVIIDSRDFLFKILSNYQLLNTEKRVTIIKELSKIFGNEIKQYFNKINKLSELDNILAVGDLICNDKKIIENYYNNQIIIGGGHNTITRYSFFVKTPIKKENIKSVQMIPNEYDFPNSEINFKELI